MLIKKSVLLKVYKKGVGSKNCSQYFTVSVLCNYTLFVVKAEVDINGLELENEIQFTLDSYLVRNYNILKSIHNI